jgi:hypothetical protein
MREIDSGVPWRLEKRLYSSLADELRAELRRVLDERPASLRELAEMFEETVGAIAPQVFELWKERSIDVYEDDAGMPLADRRFRAKKVILDEDGWEALSDEEKHDVVVVILEGLIGEAMAALRSGRLTDRPDAHLAWMPITVDEQGREEMNEILERAFREVQAVDRRSAERLGAVAAPGTSVIVSILGFERSCGSDA